MLKRNLIANYLGQGWVALMGFAFVPIYVKYLGMEAYGVVGLFATLMVWMSLLDLGMTPTLSREMARFSAGSRSVESIRDLLRSIEIITIVIAVTAATTFWCMADWLAASWLKVEKLPQAAVAEALAIMGFVVALRFLEGIYRGSLIGLQRQVAFNALSSALATIRGVGVIGVLAWFSPTLPAFFAWQGAVSILAIMVLIAATYRALPPGSRSGLFSVETLKGVWRFAGGNVAIAVLGLMLTQIDKVLLSALLTLSEYGTYILVSLVSSGVAVLIAPVAQAWSPRLSQLHAANDDAEFTKAFHLGAQVVAVILGSAGMGLVVFAEPVLRLWTGDKMLAGRAEGLLVLLTLGTVLNGLLWMLAQVQVAYGWTSLAIRMNVVAVLLIVPMLFIAVPIFGALGAAWVGIALNAGYLLIGTHFMFRRVLCREKWRWYVQDCLFPIVAGLSVLLVLRGIAPVFMSPVQEVLWMVLSGVGALAASCLSANLIKLKLVAMVWALPWLRKK